MATRNSHSDDQSSSPSPFIKRELSKVKFRVTINDFSKLTSPKVVTESFASENSSLKWHLQIFPKGREPKFVDYIAVFVHRTICGHSDKSGSLNATSNCESSPPTEGAYSLGLLDANDNVRYPRKCQGLFEDGRGWGYANFFSRATILDPANKLLLSDQLTLQCTLLFSEQEIGREYFDALLGLSPLNTQIASLNATHSKSRVSDYLRRLFDEQRSTDIHINVDGQTIGAHKSVLFVSPVFAAMFDHETQEKQTNSVDIEDLSFDTVREMLRYVYYGTIKDNQLLSELLEAADKYQMDALKLIVQQELATDISKSNIVQVLALADKHNANYLKEFALHVLIENVNSVTTIKGWQEELDKKLLSEVIAKLGKLMTQSTTGTGSEKKVEKGVSSCEGRAF